MRFQLLCASVGPAFVTILLIGFTHFLYGAESAKGQFPRKVDAIVVFSGEEQRVQRGAELLRDGWAQRMFFAGNDNGAEDIRQSKVYPALFSCCVDTAPDTANTDDDADATERWIKAKGYTSLMVVTSYSHMPRVLLELRQRLPGVRVVPSVIIKGNRDWSSWQDDPTLWRVMLLEFAKSIRAEINARLGPVL